MLKTHQAAAGGSGSGGGGCGGGNDGCGGGGGGRDDEMRGWAKKALLRPGAHDMTPLQEAECMYLDLFSDQAIDTARSFPLIVGLRNHPDIRPNSDPLAADWCVYINPKLCHAKPAPQRTRVPLVGP